MTGAPSVFQRYLAIWNGEAALDELDAIVTSSYVGHIGSRTRTLAELKEDIAEYRARAPGVVFEIEHQFGAGEFVATRVAARVMDPREQTIRGINISRWDGELLAEEWAVWEQLDSD